MKKPKSGSRRPFAKHLSKGSDVEVEYVSMTADQSKLLSMTANELALKLNLPLVKFARGEALTRDKSARKDIVFGVSTAAALQEVLGQRLRKPV